MEPKITFNDAFRSIWDTDSPILQEWSTLEVYCSSISVIAENLAVKAATFRSFADIEKDVKRYQSRAQEEALRLELIYILWNRLLLRTCSKVRDSLEFLIFSSNAANSYGCALAARGIIEHVALLNYLVQRVPWLQSPVVTKEGLQTFIKQLTLLTQGSTFNWDQFLEGSVSFRAIIASKNWKRPKDQRIPEISTLIKSLDDRLSSKRSSETAGRIEFIYSVLCDVVHPSWGGDFIYAPKPDQDMQVRKSFDVHFRKVALVLCLPMVEVTQCFVDLIRMMTDNEPQRLGFSRQ